MFAFHKFAAILNMLLCLSLYIRVINSLVDNVPKCFLLTCMWIPCRFRRFSHLRKRIFCGLVFTSLSTLSSQYHIDFCPCLWNYHPESHVLPSMLRNHFRNRWLIIFTVLMRQCWPNDVLSKWTCHTKLFTNENRLGDTLSPPWT